MKITVRRLLSLLVIVFLLIGVTACENVIIELDKYLETADVIDNSANVNDSNKDVIAENTKVNGDLEIHFIDVGQADCILIKNNEQSMLIDAGNNDDAELIKKYLKNEDITKLDYVVGTHPHEDHIGSLDVVINNFDVDTIIMPNKVSTTKTFEDVIEAIENKKLSINEAKVGDKYVLGDAEFVILAPYKDYGDELNNASVVLRLTYGENSFMFTGDAEVDSEADILKSGLTLKSDVLKFGHHGSSTSTSDKFLAAVSPKYGVIMCEEGNSYGHPHKETLSKISKNKIEVYRTDLVGTIILTSDGKNITWQTEKGNNQELDNEAVTYILNTSSKKFHLADCSGASKISPQNRKEFFGSRNELIKEGYSACGTCNP